MPTITLDEIERHSPDTLLPPDTEFLEPYWYAVTRGLEEAAETSVAFVAICRNAMPWLPRTLDLVERTGSLFRSWSCFIYENDSTDGTKDYLENWENLDNTFASINENGRPHLNYTTDAVRTHALAEYRAECQRVVASGTLGTPDYVIVFDTDPWGGWSVDGVMNSVGHMALDSTLYGLASYSWGEWAPPITQSVMAVHYDAFAARLNHWRQRDQNWFHGWHPPVGSPPVEFRSVFGQLAIYRRRQFLQGRYTGEDCEHVCFHRSIDSRCRLALNPSMRCVSFWVPEESRHGG